MNESTTQLIESLAAKLGTTAEYLWGVLLNQAAVSATISLLFAVTSITYLTIYLRWLIAKVKADELDILDYEKNVAMSMFGGAVAILSFVTIGFALPNIITGYINPEYWALQEILKHIK
jgi:transcriptional regulator with XRE-family HTH domain